MMDTVMTIVIYSGVVGGLVWLLPRAYKLGYEKGKEEALEELKELYWTYQLEDKEGNKA